MTVRHKLGNSAKSEPDDDHPGTGGNLLELVEADLPLLAKYWICAIRDYVLLMLPPQYAPQLPIEGGSFYRHVMGTGEGSFSSISNGLTCAIRAVFFFS